MRTRKRDARVVAFSGTMRENVKALEREFAGFVGGDLGSAVPAFRAAAR
jgi:hypothetical protein